MRFLLFILLFCLTLFAQTQGIVEISKAVFNNIQITRYNHKSHIDEAKGEYILDCSSFVVLLLKKVSPLALASLTIDKTHTHARAKNFYDFFHSLANKEQKGGWIGIKKMREVEAGDIIAWKYDPSLAKKDTGHVVVVLEKPVNEEDGLYRIKVMDASKGKHANDTRVRGTDGVGMGEMWFRVDTSDKPIALHWSDKAKKPSYHAIAMGRVAENEFTYCAFL